ncbi:Lrp/AsnC family transcriptional regulator [Bacillus thuringiensis]|nr:Lrp/AsnC family transcriptional regulator [Bacillus thuringiensis]MCT4571158.1 Lrp/AsnC family transcriptional regulator [Bacillus thuringiensis]
MLDDTDKKILEALLKNGRTSMKELGEKVHLTGQATSSRVIRLEEKGIIEGYTIKLNERKLGYYVHAFINIYTRSIQHSSYLSFVKTQHEYIIKNFKISGEVSGIVFNHPDEPRLYVAGDTIWCNDVQQAIDTHDPEVIVINGGAAQFLEGGPITMTKEDIYDTKQAAPQAKIIVSHMESLNHCLLTRKELNDFIDKKGLSNTILVPSDGESYSF